MLTYREGRKAARAGLDLVVSLTPEQAAALGGDAALLGEAFDTVLAAVAALRTGPTPPYTARPSLKDGRDDPQWQEWVIRDIATLSDRLAGVQAAAIRSHAAQEGTYAELAAAMGVPRSTAQRRRDTITAAAPGEDELWATTPAAPVDEHDAVGDADQDEDQAVTVVNVATTGHRPVQLGTHHGDVHL